MWSCISIFMYITLMTDGVGHLTMCSSAFIYLLWGSSLYKSCPFPNWVVCFFLLNPECLYLFWYKSFVKYVTCKYFIPLWGVSFYLQRVLCRAKVLNFYQVQIIFLLWIMPCTSIWLRDQSLRKLCLILSHKIPTWFRSGWSIKHWASLGSFLMWYLWC